MQTALADRRPSPVRMRTPEPSALYVFEEGLLYACEGLETPRTERCTVTLMVATTGRDFELAFDGRVERLGAVLLSPRVPKAIHAARTPFVSVELSLLHPSYRAFVRFGAQGHMALGRALFAPQHDALQRLRDGELSLDEGRQVFDDCVATVTAHLPPPPPLDARLERVLALLHDDPTRSLDALAEAACLSTFRLSHLFSREMGLSLRQYAMALKVHTAFRCIGAGMSLTATAHAAGFTDSAHLSHAWTKIFGGSPTQFMRPGVTIRHVPPGRVAD